jgi:peptidoglycan hydrolase-like protein with peptidoglycan-binding domain
MAICQYATSGFLVLGARILKVTATVAKFDLILLICFVAVSGCGLCDCQKAATDTLSVTVVETKPIPAADIVEIARPTDVAPTIVRARALTNDDVRRLQRGLREIGFDPGPVDGVAGARTKAAYVRLQSGCSKLALQLDELSLYTAEGQLTAGAAARDKLPSRRETQEIQGQLREAGLYPGPVDGVFGSRTQLALRKFKAGCLMGNEFKEILQDTLPAILSETADIRPEKTSISSSKAEARLARSADDQQASAVQAVQATERVRILQLRLRDAGFDPGELDGLMGTKTKSALAQYEASRGGEKTKTRLTNPTVRGQC